MTIMTTDNIKLKFITAADALKKTKAVLEALYVRELEEIYGCIYKAINAGETHCTFYKYITDTSCNWLKNKGYNIERNSNQHDGSWTNISWEMGSCNMCVENFEEVENEADN